MNSQILLFIFKLILGGIVAFLSIWILSKTRDTEWIFIIIGFILLYASLVYDLLIELGILAKSTLLIFNIPILSLIFAIIPSICFIIAFIIKLLKK